MSAAGPITIKLVCKDPQGSATSLCLDKIDAISTTPVSDEQIVSSIKNMQLQYFGRDGWNGPFNYGRMYVSVPYVEGSEKLEGIEVTGPTTTTTLAPPKQEVIKVPANGWDMENRDLGYVDCRWHSKIYDSNDGGSYSEISP